MTGEDIVEVKSHLHVLYSQSLLHVALVGQTQVRLRVAWHGAELGVVEILLAHEVRVPCGAESLVVEIHETVEDGARRVCQCGVGVVCAHRVNRIPVGIACCHILVKVLYLVFAQCGVSFQTHP